MEYKVVSSALPKSLIYMIKKRWPNIDPLWYKSGYMIHIILSCIIGDGGFYFVNSL